MMSAVLSCQHSPSGQTIILQFEFIKEAAMFMVMHITYTKDLINIYNLLAYTSKGSTVTHVVDCMHRALIVPSISQ